MERDFSNYAKRVFVKNKLEADFSECSIYRQINDEEYILIKKGSDIDEDQFFHFNMLKNSFDKLELPQIDRPQNFGHQNMCGVFDPFGGEEKQAFYDIKASEVFYAFSKNIVNLFNWEQKKKVTINLEWNSPTGNIIKLLKSEKFLVIFDGDSLFLIELENLYQRIEKSSTSDSIDIPSSDISEIKFDESIDSTSYFHLYEVAEIVYLTPYKPSFERENNFELVLEINLLNKYITKDYIPLISEYTGIHSLFMARKKNISAFNFYVVIIQLFRDFIGIVDDPYSLNEINIYSNNSIVMCNVGHFTIDYSVVEELIEKERSFHIENKYFQYYNLYSKNIKAKEAGILQFLNNRVSETSLINIYKWFKFDYEKLAVTIADRTLQSEFVNLDYIHNNIIFLLRQNEDFIDFAKKLIRSKYGSAIIGLELLKGGVKDEFDVDDESTEYIYDKNEDIPYEQIFKLVKDEAEFISQKIKQTDSVTLVFMSSVFEKILTTCASWKNSYTDEIFRWTRNQNLSYEADIMLIRLIGEYKLNSLTDLLESYIESNNDEVVVATLEAMGELKLNENQVLKLLRSNNSEVYKASLNYFIEAGTINALNELFYSIIITSNEQSDYDKPIEVVLSILVRIFENAIEEKDNIYLENLNRFLLLSYVLVLSELVKHPGDAPDEEAFNQVYFPENFTNNFADIISYKDVSEIINANDDSILRKVILKILERVNSITDQKTTFKIALIISLKRGFVLAGKKDSQLTKIIFLLKDILEKCYIEFNGFEKKLACVALLEIGADKKYEELVKEVIRKNDFQDYPNLKNLYDKIFDYTDPINKIPQLFKELENYSKEYEADGSDFDKMEIMEKKVEDFFYDFMIYHFAENESPELEQFFSLLVKMDIIGLKDLPTRVLTKLKSRIT